MFFCCFISAHRPRGTVPAQNHNAATAAKEKEVHVRNCVILEKERGQEMKGKTGGRRAKEVEESEERQKKVQEREKRGKRGVIKKRGKDGENKEML